MLRPVDPIGDPILLRFVGPIVDPFLLRPVEASVEASVVQPAIGLEEVAGQGTGRYLLLPGEHHEFCLPGPTEAAAMGPVAL